PGGPSRRRPPARSPAPTPGVRAARAGAAKRTLESDRARVARRGFYHADNLGGRRPRTAGMRADTTLRVLCLVCVFAGAALACTPATDLTNVPATGATPPPPSGPAAGATGVPLNLAGITVRFPAPVTWGPAGLVVCDGETPPVPSSPPADTPCA